MTAIMLDTDIVSSVAKQMMTSKAIEMDGKLTPLGRTGGYRLRRVAFQIHRHDHQAIEENPKRRADGVNWRNMVIRSCSSKTRRQTDLCSIG